MKKTKKSVKKADTRKMYVATATFQTMFVCDENDDEFYKAAGALERELEEHGCDIDNLSGVEIKEAKSMKDVPKNWHNALLWGMDNPITPRKWLAGERGITNEEDDLKYQEYLRLKEIYG